MAVTEPILIKFHRHRYGPGAVLYDPELELHTVDDLRDWASRNVNFIVIDSDTGEDITRVLLA
jgi:polyhydroxyalkanoate synthesis regulator protein